MSTAAQAAAFAPRLMQACPDLVLREERDEDMYFLRDLYAATRAEEMAPVQWTEEAKQNFLGHQFALQGEHYRRHYGGAELLVIERGGERIGRIYLHRNKAVTEIRLMEVALIDAARGQGIGTRLVRALIEIANADGCRVTLHVEPNNPAQRLYARFGFSLIEDRGVQHFLGREPAPVS